MSSATTVSSDSLNALATLFVLVVAAGITAAALIANRAARRRAGDGQTALSRPDG